MSLQMIRNVSSPKSLKKAREVALKILESSPGITKELLNSPLIKPNLSLNHQASLSTVIQSPGLYADPDSARRQSGPIIQQMSTSQPKINAPVDLWQKKYIDLDAKYKKLEKDFVECKANEKMKEERYLRREVKFKQLVRDLEDSLRSRFPKSNEEEKRLEIDDLHNTVLQKIDGIQSRTSKIMLDQEKDIIRFFENKLNEIKNEYEGEKTKFLDKNEKFATREANLIAEVEWIKDIAQKIDNENQTLTKKYKDLKIVSSLKCDEDKLRNECATVKRKNALLQNKLTQYEKIVEEYSKELENRTSGSIVNTSTLEPKFLTTGSNMETSPNASFLGTTQDKSPVGSMKSFFPPIPNKNGRCLALDMSNRSIVDTMQRSPDSKAEGVINQLKARLGKEKKQKQEFKSAYIKELECKTELEGLIKECIQEVRQSMHKVQREKLEAKKNVNQGDFSMTEQERNQLIEKLIQDERILALLYDKTFYSKKRNDKNLEIDMGDDDDDL